MYAAGYVFAKKLKRDFYLDNETAYKSRKNISKYDLDIFNFTANVAESNLKFVGLKGYLKRKILKKIDYFKECKSFYVESKDENKISIFTDNLFFLNLNKIVFIEGHFESEKYFSDFSADIKNEFAFKNKNLFQKNKFFKLIYENNSVAICIRQNRFSEGKGRSNVLQNEKKSWKYTLEQINFALKCVKLFESKITNPKFFLWSNSFKNLENYFPQKKFVHVINNNNNLIENHLNFFLMTQAKHFIVIPSSYNWWGSWLSENHNKIILRPSSAFFSDFKTNNKDYWPNNWLKIEP